MGMGVEKELYERLGLDFEVLDSGCCALAGSFGFERDHDQISREIAEQRPGAPTPVLKSNVAQAARLRDRREALRRL